MDLSFIQEQLNNFATFAGAIGDFLQLPPKILDQVFGWFGDGFVTGKGDDAVTHIFSSDLQDTSSALGSSEGDGEGFTSSLSSGDNGAE